MIMTGSDKRMLSNLIVRRNACFAYSRWMFNPTELLRLLGRKPIKLREVYLIV